MRNWRNISDERKVLFDLSFGEKKDESLKEHLIILELFYNSNFLLVYRQLC